MNKTAYVELIQTIKSTLQASNWSAAIDTKKSGGLTIRTYTQGNFQLKSGIKGNEILRPRLLFKGKFVCWGDQLMEDMYHHREFTRLNALFSSDL